MSGFKAPEHTQVPNSFFEMMSDMSEVELRVTLCAIRKTFGWHKRQDAISLTQFQKMTGLSRQGVLNGIEESEKRGTIRKAGKGKRNTTIFELCVIEEQPKPQPENVVSLDQSTQLTSTSQDSRPEVVKTVDTQKKENKEKETNNNARAHEDTSPNESASVLVQEIDDSLKDIITLFKNVFPDYIERPDKPTFQQDAKKLQTLLNVHGYESLKLALEKCAGMTVQSPFAYLKTILEAPEHKQAVAIKEQTVTAIVPYHQDAPVDNTPAMSDAEAQQALQEIRAQLKERGVKFKALQEDEKPEPDTQKDDAA